MFCNMYRGGNIGVYTLKLQKLYGEGIIKELTKKSKEIKQWTPDELREIAKRYEIE